MGKNRSRQSLAQRPGSVQRRPVAFHPEITPPPPPYRLYSGQPDSARPGIERPGAFQSPSVLRKEISIGERRWYAICQRKKFARANPIRAMEAVMQKVRRRLPNIDPNVAAEQWLDQLMLESNRVHVETCWYESSDSTPSHIQAIQCVCSGPNASPKLFTNMIEIPHGWTNVIYHSSSQ